MRDVLFIARKDIQYILRERSTLVWLFAMPLVFMYFTGTVTGGFTSVQNPKGVPITLSGANDAGILVDQLTLRLNDNGYSVAGPAEEAIRELVIPESFTDSVLTAKPVTIEYRSEAEGLVHDLDMLRVGRAIYTVLADVIVVSKSVDLPGPADFEKLNATPRAVTLVVESAGQRKTIPNGFEQAIPGNLVMFTLMVLLTSGAAFLVIERDRGLLRRLASTPIHRSAIVAGKWGGKMALGAVQVVFAMLAGTLLFDMSWGSSPLTVFALILCWAAFCGSLGLLLGSIARTQGQAVGLGVFGTLLLAALGGCWWPIEITPAWMQALQRFLPTGWVMDGMHRLVSFGEPGTAVLPHMTVLIVSALILGFVAVRNFRFQ